MVKLFTSFFLFTGFLAVLLPEGNSLRCHSCYSAKSWDDCVKNSVILDCSNMDLQAERKPSEVRCAEVFTSQQTKNGQQLDHFAKFCTTWDKCDDERCREEITKSGDKDALKAKHCDVECCSGDLCNGALPVVDVYPRNQTVLEGRPTLMICTAKGVPHQALSWTFENGELPSDAAISSFSDQSILHLVKTSKSMQGWYTCKAKNKAGEACSNSSLHVLGFAVRATATVQWYFIVGPLLAVTIFAFMVLYLWKRRIAGRERPADVEEELEMGTLNADVDKWEISRQRITLEEVIGSGSFGTVWRAVLSSGNGQPGIQFVAAKCFTPTSGEEGLKSIMKEIRLGKELGDSHRENVVQFIGCVTSQIHPILIMEYLPCGDLLGYLRKSRGIVDKYFRGEGEVANLKTYELVSFSNQIASGMVFLASRGIIHRDLAARNVLLDRKCTCKVADFGLYYHNFKYGHGNAKKGCVPVKWTAPEVLYGNIANLSSKSDVSYLCKAPGYF